MPGDQEIPQGLRPHGIRRHGSVAEPHHQHRTLRRQQVPEELAQGLHRPGEVTLLPLPEAVQIQCEVGPHRLSQGLRAPGVQDLHPGDGVSLPPLRPGTDAGQLCGLRRALLPELLGLQGQVRALFQMRLRHGNAPFPCKLIRISRELLPLRSRAPRAPRRLTGRTRFPRSTALQA